MSPNAQFPRNQPSNPKWNMTKPAADDSNNINNINNIANIANMSNINNKYPSKDKKPAQRKRKYQSILKMSISLIIGHS